MIGHRARFTSNLEQWKTIIQGIPNMNTDMVYTVIFYLKICIIKYHLHTQFNLIYRHYLLICILD